MSGRTPAAQIQVSVADPGTSNDKQRQELSLQVNDRLPDYPVSVAVGQELPLDP